MKILLLGGGYVLSALAQKLPSAIITTRHLEAKNTRTFLDLNDLALTKNYFAKEIFDIIIFSVPPKFEIGDSNFSPKNIQAEINFSEALINPPKKLIYLSTTGVYGGEKGEIVSESSPLNPKHSRAEARCQVETLFSIVPGFTSFRISGIQGPGRSTVNSIRSGTYPLIDTGDRFSNRIHLVDIIQALEWAIEAKDLPQAINITDNQPTPQIEVVKFFCEKYKLPLPRGISTSEAQNRKMYSILGNQQVSNQLLRSKISMTYSDYRFYE